MKDNIYAEIAREHMSQRANKRRLNAGDKNNDNNQHLYQQLQ